MPPHGGGLADPAAGLGKSLMRPRLLGAVSDLARQRERLLVEGPGLADVDLSLFKNTVLTERIKLQFRAEFFNALNRMNLGTPNATAFSGTSVSASAGLITALSTTPRQIQFGLKLIF